MPKQSDAHQSSDRPPRPLENSLAAAGPSAALVPQEMQIDSMGHKILKDHAHTICQMFVGWRMAQDLEILAAIPEGQLTIDVLRGECQHESLGRINSSIASEISAWFKHRLTAHGIEQSEVLQAVLTVQLNRIPQTSKRRSGVTFDWRCDGFICTIDREYRSQLHESHTWVPAETPNPIAGSNNPLDQSGGSAVS